jgi:hypothetical protein
MGQSEPPQNTRKLISVKQAISGTGGKTFGDFWSWAYSDVLSNGNRSVFAEYIVGLALGVVETPRIEWNRIDLMYQGKGIEVKASAYVQSWDQQDRLSRISYDIGRKLGWDAETNVNAKEHGRTAACYVFCLYPEKDRSLCDMSNVLQWHFYVLSTSKIEERFSNQKSVCLSRIRCLTEQVDYSDLKNSVDSALQVV